MPKLFFDMYSMWSIGVQTILAREKMSCDTKISPGLKEVENNRTGFLFSLIVHATVRSLVQ